MDYCQISRTTLFWWSRIYMPMPNKIHLSVHKRCPQICGRLLSPSNCTRSHGSIFLCRILRAGKLHLMNLIRCSSAQYYGKYWRIKKKHTIQSGSHFFVQDNVSNSACHKKHWSAHKEKNKGCKLMHLKACVFMKLAVFADMQNQVHRTPGTWAICSQGQVSNTTLMHQSSE